MTPINTVVSLLKYSNTIKMFSLKIAWLALAGVTQLVAVSSCNQRVVDSIPGQGTYQGCEFDPWSGCIWEASNLCFSLTPMILSLSLPLFLKTMEKNVLV